MTVAWKGILPKHREEQSVRPCPGTLGTTMRSAQHIHRDDLMKPDPLSETTLIVGLVATAGLLFALLQLFE